MASMPLYIYDVPLSVRNELSTHIDTLNLWEELAKLMGLRQQEKDNIRNQKSRNQSPTLACLDIWGGRYNHTVNELVLLMYQLQLPKAMKLLENHVDTKHQKFILKALTNFQRQEHHNGVNISNSNNDTGYSNQTNQNPVNRNNYNHIHRPVERVDDLNQTADLSESKVLQDVKPIPEIDFNELTLGTNNWSDKNVLGKGGFGKVYKGSWSQSDVAIKVMEYRWPNGNPDVKVEIQQSLNELKHLMSRYHPNIVMLYGYSIKGGRPCLVYHLMKGGSLEHRLKAEKYEQLTWKQRYNICRDTAAGINYLHTERDGKVIIHGDIKLGNILLDECLNAKIGDFGLAREIPRDKPYKVTKIFGTKAYLPAEYLQNKLLSETIDIFSFGVVLIETFTNKRASNNQDLPGRIWKFVQNVTEAGEGQVTKDRVWKSLQQAEGMFDQRINPPSTGEELEMCADILREALQCTADKAKDRPKKLEHVIETFDKYKKFRNCDIHLVC